ncbi:hypothetical protein SNEBB_001481 [Seison nebaliae]|nr:hypothetical protein SNEBB_001481 [Seison nebaliae]
MTDLTFSKNKKILISLLKESIKWTIFGESEKIVSNKLKRNFEEIMNNEDLTPIMLSNFDGAVPSPTIEFPDQPNNTFSISSNKSQNNYEISVPRLSVVEDSDRFDDWIAEIFLGKEKKFIPKWVNDIPIVTYDGKRGSPKNTSTKPYPNIDQYTETMNLATKNYVDILKHFKLYKNYKT